MTASVRGISAEGREGTIDLDKKEYTVIYKVHTDDKQDGPAIVRTAFGIPAIGAIYVAGNDSDNSAVVVEKVATQLAVDEWEVAVKYSTDTGQDEPTAIDNPLLEPPDITFGFEERRIAIPGIFNDPIGPPSDGGWEAGLYAPNGELFDPQPEADYADPVMHVRKNVQTINRYALMILANCVNSDNFDGATPRQYRLKPVTAVRKFNPNVQFYFELSYSLVFRFETWDIQRKNEGHYYWPGGKPTSVWGTTILPSVKKLLSGEVRLGPLTTNGDLNTTGVDTFTRIRFYREIPFTPLQLF